MEVWSTGDLDKWKSECKDVIQGVLGFMRASKEARVAVVSDEPAKVFGPTAHRCSKAMM